METVEELAYQLHDKLIESIEYKELKNAESIMLNDKLAKSLIDNYHKLQELYSSDKKEETNKKLHQAKLEMDLNPLVIAYKLAYKNYQILVGNITDVVFKDFKSDTLVEKIIRKVINN